MKKLMFLLIIPLASLLFVSGNALALTFAVDVGWDVGTDYNSDGDSLTEDLVKFEANIGSWIKQSTTQPGTFKEFGVFKIDTLYAADGSNDDLEGFTSTSSSKYSITGVVEDLNGSVLSYFHNGAYWQLNYTLGSDNDADGDLHLYLQNGYVAGDAAQDMSTYYTSGGTYGSIDGGSVLDKYDSGTSFADLRIKDSFGTIFFDENIFTVADPTQVSIMGGLFNAQFEFVAGNQNWSWKGTSFDDWEDFGYSFGAALTSTLAYNTGYSYIGAKNAEDIDILTDLQDATTFNGIPEPTTFILLGIGLLGLSGINRRINL